MTDFGGPILFTPECEWEIKQRWPDVCPECGCVAWVGLIQAHGVNANCRLGTEENSQEYHDLLDEYATTSPGISLTNEYLSLPNLEELKLFTHAKPQVTFDWRDFVENNLPTSTNAADTEWTYTLPAGATSACYIGDQMTCGGVKYCICAMDRFAETITVMTDRRP